MTITIRRNQDFTDLLNINLQQRYEGRRRIDDKVHVSDIIPTTCIRKQYFSRKHPEMDPISSDSMHNFIRGEASEFVITNLVNIGVAQPDIESDGIIAHPDVMVSNEVVIELKDTLSGKRLDITDEKFRSYLRQLLYYLVITSIEKGILSIRYNCKEFRWIRSDSEGDYYFKPRSGKEPGIESWSVFLPKGDISREILKNEMVRRKNLFLNALHKNDVSMLPKLTERYRGNKCTLCKFYDLCMDNSNEEADEAKEMANEIDLFDISGVLDFKPL
jgi:CRISPR/Cas system-associated exonuclease Cas4 (RecB family)